MIFFSDFLQVLFCGNCNCKRLFGCKIIRTVFEYAEEISYLNFLTEMFSYHCHLLVIRKKWLELSPHPSFVLTVTDFYNNCNNFFFDF